MALTQVQGVIRRRLLVNFRAHPDHIQPHLPAPFQPKLHEGSAIVGICLIRLEQIRPQGVNLPVGLSSENAAHRIAVRWTDANGVEREGVYIPRRDTGSTLNHLAGGRLFPGEHHQADFEVHDQDGQINLSMRSRDGLVAVNIAAHEADALSATSEFDSLEEASEFFRAGSSGFSATKSGTRLDGLELDASRWAVTPLSVQSVFSSFFADPTRFPKDAVRFDCALLMRDIPHRWHAVPDPTA
jgi:uncharacterized protein YqjF (DUF2071 family)